MASGSHVSCKTLDDSKHFFGQSSLSQPQMMVVPDLDDMFLPLPEDLLVNLSESRAVVESLLESLPTMFKDYHVESALGPALQAASLLMVRNPFYFYNNM